MAEVSIRELRDHGGDVVDRVSGGERVTVTRRGKPLPVYTCNPADFTGIDRLQVFAVPHPEHD